MHNCKECIIFVSLITTKRNNKMTNLNNTPENNAKVKALRTVKETDWVGEVIHENISTCFTAINLFQGVNSGWYEAAGIRIKGVKGIFMINQDGSLNFESRVIKIDNNKYKIEHLTSAGYAEFENKFIEHIDA